MQSAHTIEPALIANALIHVPVHAANTPSAMLIITIRCALVCQDIPEIRSTNAIQSELHVRFLPFYRPIFVHTTKSKTIFSNPPSAAESDTFVVNPCIPSPCGQFAQCNDHNGVAVCKCVPSYYGSPPHCRSECSVNSDCSNINACVNEHCVDPCPGACGLNTVCNVINHTPNCACRRGYEGDAFVRCQPIVVARKNRFYSLATSAVLIKFNPLCSQYNLFI